MKMQKLFENWRQYIVEDQFLDEAAIMDTSNLAIHQTEGGMIILYLPKAKMQSALMKSDYDIVEQFIIGASEYRINNKYEAWEIETIFAKKGYGPLLYRIVMQLSDDMGIIPNQTGAVSSAAKKVWQNFYNGAGAQYVDKEPLAKDKYEENYLNVALMTKESLDLSGPIAKDKQMFARDKYGEMATVLEEVADFMIRNKMSDIYG